MLFTFVFVVVHGNNNFPGKVERVMRVSQVIIELVAYMAWYRVEQNLLHFQGYCRCILRITTVHVLYRKGTTWARYYLQTYGTALFDAIDVLINMRRRYIIRKVTRTLQLRTRAFQCLAYVYYLSFITFKVRVIRGRSVSKKAYQSLSILYSVVITSVRLLYQMRYVRITYMMYCADVKQTSPRGVVHVHF